MEPEDKEKYEAEYEPDHFLFAEEGPGDHLFIIKSGKVDLLKNTDQGTRLVTTVGPGDIIGEMALVEDDARRSTSARARTEVTCWELTRDRFDSLLETNQSFRDRIIQLLSKRLRRTTESFARTKGIKDFLYEASLLIFNKLSLLDELEREKKTVDLNDINWENLKRLYRMDDQTVETARDHPDRSSLSELSPEERDKFTEQILNVLEPVLELYKFRTGNRKQNGEEQIARNKTLGNSS
ncbi:MAG: cyclic nucleotide-binding domain-containing protein [bacterium]